MSLSQKHPGIVFVPWFNVEEWTAVYNMIYSEVNKNWSKALKIMKIWKLRTPLLSAGVEGTLILLEALTAENSKDYEISHIYSSSLIRFLNLCAANNDKQGTFYRTAMKNELPKWLISLRHEIAHSHKIPPKPMLELSINFCLGWLKTKYWDVQSNYMENKNFEIGGYVDQAIGIFSHLIAGWIPNRNDALFTELESFYSNLENIPTNLQTILTDVENVIKQVDPDFACRNLSTRLLFNEELMLKCEIDSSNDVTDRLSKSSTDQWSYFFDFLYVNGLLTQFNRLLLNYVCDDSNDRSKREICSLWLKEIFQGLSCQNKSIKDELFENQVLKKPTEFTENFLNELLTYNSAPARFYEDVTRLISSYTNAKSMKGPVLKSQKISTVTDLGVTFQNIDSCVTKKPQIGKWRKVLDPSSYRKLPLGILENQSIEINPVMDI